MSPKLQAEDRPHAFTLVELLVGTAVFLVILVLMVSMLSLTSDVFRKNAAVGEQFREARRAFDSMSRSLSQATLNTYWDYQRNSANQPVRYVRSSELRFISGPVSGLGLPSTMGTPVSQAVFFQAPEGVSDNSTIKGRLNSLLNTMGFYVTYGSDSTYRPGHITATTAFRLFAFDEPAENLTLYNHTSGVDAGNIRRNTYVGKEWFTVPLATAANSAPLASNILALVIEPMDPANDLVNGIYSSNFQYDSSPTTNFTVAGAAQKQNRWENNLPPMVRVTMVAVDEASSKRLEPAGITPAYINGLFQNPTELTANLEALENQLIAKKLVHQVFSNQIPIEASKWSSE